MMGISYTLQLTADCDKCEKFSPDLELGCFYLEYPEDELKSDIADELSRHGWVMNDDEILCPDCKEPRA